MTAVGRRRRRLHTTLTVKRRLETPHTPHWDRTTRTNQMSVRLPPWHTFPTLPARFPKRPHYEVADALCSRSRWTGPLQSRYRSSEDRSDALLRFTVHGLSLKPSTQAMHRHKDFVLRLTQGQPMTKQNKTGRRISNPQVVQRMGEGPHTPLFSRLTMGVLMCLRSTRFGISLGVLGCLTLLWVGLEEEPLFGGIRRLLRP